LLWRRPWRRNGSYDGWINLLSLTGIGYNYRKSVIANPSTMIVAHTTSGIRFDILALSRQAIFRQKAFTAPAVLSSPLSSGSGLEAEPQNQWCP